MAQAGRALDLDPYEIAYYAAQPKWFVLTTDLATLLPIAAGVALLMRSRAGGLAVRVVAVPDRREQCL